MAQPGSVTFRRMHLGVDYGTAWSKLVLRDMEARAGEAEAFVLRPESEPGDFRFPSLVTHLKDRLYFGWKAEELRDEPGATVLGSLKMRMVDDILKGSYGVRAPLPEKLKDEDLAVLTIFYLLQEGVHAAREYAAKRRAEPRISVTLGVPMTPVCYPEIQTIFSRVAARAFWILKEGRWRRMQNVGIHVYDAIAASEWSREAVNGPLRPEQWVRSEAGAAMHWAMYSPRVEEGLYAAVDIGAGTTSTSVFNIVARFERQSGKWEKSTIAVFGASCGAPAMDQIDQILAKQIDGGDGMLLRGKESEHSGTIDAGAAFVEVHELIEANRHSAFRQAYSKYRRQSDWMTERFKGVFLFGGGNRLDCLRRRSRGYVWPWSPTSFPESRLDWPEDLRVGLEPDGHSNRDASAFASDLLVGYGLSFPAAGVFPVENPESIEPVSIKDLYRNRAWRDREDLYAK